MTHKLMKVAFSRMAVLAYNGINKNLIIEMLTLLPNDAALIGVGSDPVQLMDYMVFSSQTFKEVGVAQNIPEIIVWFRRQDDGSVKVEKLQYPEDPQSENAESECAHDWQIYHGLTDTWEYCAKCSVAKP